MNLTYLTLEAPREGQASYVHVREIISGLRKQGVEVTLFEPCYAKREASPSLILRLFYALLLQFNLWLKWRRGSVLYIRAHYMAFPSALIAHLFGVTTVHEINGPYEDVFVTYPRLNKLRGLLIFLQRWQYRKATSLIAVTKELQEWANKEGERNDCTFVSNGANVDIFKPIADIGQDKPLDAPESYVVFFGGLTRWHGVDVMLNAVNDNKWPEGLKLVIIGKGQESDSVKEAVKLNDKIVYLGKRPYQELAVYVSYAKASLVMISNPDNRSNTGVFPLKLFETLACGVPAIVSDLPGQADFVREYNCGFVVPVDDSDSLIQAVNEVINSPDEACKKGVNGHNVVVQEHSWFKRSEQTLAVIKEKT